MKSGAMGNRNERRHSKTIQALVTDETRMENKAESRREAVELFNTWD
jgi:hypothetical protein